MNKKLIALFVAIATVSAMSADYGDCYYNERGEKVCKDVVQPVRSTGRFAGRVAKGTGEAAAEIFTFGAYKSDEEKAREEEIRREREERENYRD